MQENNNNQNGAQEQDINQLMKITRTRQRPI